MAGPDTSRTDPSGPPGSTRPSRLGMVGIAATGRARVASHPGLPRAPARREGTPSMDPRTAATRVPDPDAVDFIRFCYRRRRVGWPELYDEMCAVAGTRPVPRDSGPTISPPIGIGFALFDMPALAAMSPADRRRGAGAPPTGGRDDHAARNRSSTTRTGIGRGGRGRRRAQPARRAIRPSGSGARRGLTGPHALDPGPRAPVRSSSRGVRCLCHDCGRRIAAGRGRRSLRVGGPPQARMRRLAISPSIWRSAST